MLDTASPHLVLTSIRNQVASGLEVLRGRVLIWCQGLGFIPSTKPKKQTKWFVLEGPCDQLEYTKIRSESGGPILIQLKETLEAFIRAWSCTHNFSIWSSRTIWAI